MATVEVHRSIEPQLADSVTALLRRVEATTGRQALSDHLLADLAEGGGEGFVGTVVTDSETGGVAGYAQASAANANHAVELVIDPAQDAAGLGRDLLDATLSAIAATGGGQVNWWVRSPGPEDERAATEVGMETTRTLYQMRRPLPVGQEATITTRSFVVGQDEEAWVAVNNRAFAGHGEQGGWRADTLRRRETEPWFDAEGFRRHECDGRLAGFCGTKVHPATAVDPRLGEIYVIAVDPDFHGLGLGREMTLAGLDHLAGRGIADAMLWFDAGNGPAVGLYEKLGFSVAATNVAFTAEIAPA
ncbi:MAG: mycothiol synthase [Ilumatobacteraceae bacterium]